MKRKLIIVLFLVNAALLIALAVSSGPRQAKAQTFPTTDYLMMTAQLSQTLDGLCVVDLASRRMVGYRLRQAGPRFTLVPCRAVRDLDRDFGRKRAAGGP